MREYILENLTNTEALSVTVILLNNDNWRNFPEHFCHPIYPLPLKLS